MRLHVSADGRACVCSLLPLHSLACRNGIVVPYGDTVGAFVRGFRAASPLPSFAPRGLPDSEMQLQNLGKAGHSLGKCAFLFLLKSIKQRRELLAPITEEPSFLVWVLLSSLTAPRRSPRSPDLVSCSPWCHLFLGP